MKSAVKTNIIALASVRIFTFKDLWLFLVGILFVSITSGSIGAFMVGVSEEQFFVREADNILIVTGPGATTPFTGSVPESLKDDILKIKGVLEISLETLGLSVAQNLNEKSVVIRGITPIFNRLTITKLLEGSWFNPIYDQVNDSQTKKTQVNGVMVGYLLAEDLGLSTGDKIQLVSTLTDMVVDVVVTGIIRTNGPCDEELLISLSLGKVMTGKQSSFVSFIRVLIDEDIISKETLSIILDNQYTVPIMLSTQDPKLVNTLVGTPIVAYTPYGAHIETQLIGEGNRTEFKLRFGTYEFVATPEEAQNSPPLTVFVNQSFRNPVKMEIGRAHYDLQVNITYNTQPAKDASVDLVEKFRPNVQYPSQTNEDGLALFSSISENYYEINVRYRGIIKSMTIRLNQSMDVSIGLDNFLSLTILNISSEREVHGGTIRIFNQSDSSNFNQIDNYQSETPIYLDLGIYLVEFHYDKIVRKFNIFINESIYRTIYVGKASLHIWVRGENEQSLASTNVTILGFNGSVTQALTNNSGLCDFQLDVDLPYTITSIPEKNQSRVQTQTINFKKSFLLIIDFLDNYRLDISVFNGTASNISDSTLAGCNIEVLKNSNLIFSGVTNSTGQRTIDFNEPGSYLVIVEKEEFSWAKSPEIRHKNTKQLIKLGNVHLFVLTESITGYPISGVNASVKHKNNIVCTGISNSSGIIEFVFPIGNYSLRTFTERGYFSEVIIFYKESQVATILKIIELSGNLTIIVSNQFSQNITRAYIVLANDYYDIKHIGFTDQNGEILFNEIPWGNYSLQITYKNNTFPRFFIKFSEDEKSDSIQIETRFPVLDISEYSYWQSSSLSVILSSDFVSGFLETTLTIFVTSFTGLVIIISVLSLLSIASVISHPIVSNERTLQTFQQLGATRNQVILGVVLHISIYGAIASAFGALFGMGIMIYFPAFHNMNLGGVIIRPKMNIWLFFSIFLSNLVVIILKAGQKTQELYKLR